MKNTHKILSIIGIVIVIAAVFCGVYSVSAQSDDPADSYVVQTAPNEDSSINMWFDYSFRKTFTSDKISTGMNTFSIYMAKNEIESAQFVLYSDTTHSKMNAEISEFTDGKGNSVSAEIYYEMYVTTENLATEYVYSMSAEDSIIRAGETPDPVVPLANFGSFQLNGGKSQAFLIRATTTLDSVSGWYSAQLNIKDSAGNVVKTATVYLYVWNIEISEKTVFQTALYTDSNTDFGGTYTDFYNYLLDNRLNAMDIPYGAPSSTNSYVTNDRVNSIRITSSGIGSVSSTGYMDGLGEYGNYKSQYTDFVTSSIWDEVKDKLYFYTVDEPMSKEQQDAISQVTNGATSGHTFEDAITYSEYLKNFWPDAQTVVPMHENGPFPSYVLHKAVNDSNFQDYQLKDGVQGMIEADAATIWCPQIYAFTPSSYLTGYSGNNLSYYGIRSLDGTVSGIYSVEYSGSSTGYAYAAGYYNWSKLYGDFSDRIRSYISVKNSNGGNSKLWMYRAGGNGLYTYCHHLIESTGLQTKMMFWQCYQEGITGYLYYDTNGWGSSYGNIDTTVTGAKTTCTWDTNKYTYPNGNNIYGMGVLFYGSSMGKVKGLKVIGTLRVELMRDGIEEYQMLSMLADLKGNKASQDIVSEVSDNVVQYISLNNFDTSAWPSYMDEYDIMEAVRRQLGNTLETAITENCEHSYDDGVVTIEAGCLTLGQKELTCSKCGAVELVDIPAKHTTEETFTLISEVPATCTEDGTQIYQCTECGYRRSKTITAFHNDTDYYVFEYYDARQHNAKCSVCGTKFEKSVHRMITTIVHPTCESEGYSADECKYCGYKIDEKIKPIIDHEYVNGVCTMCGQPEHVVVYGDIDGNGKVNSADLNTLTKYITGTVTIDQYAIEAADVSGDGKVNSADSNYMIKYISGSIAIFPSEK